MRKLTKYEKMRIGYTAVGFALGAVIGAGGGYLIDRRQGKRHDLSFYLLLGGMVGGLGGTFGYMVARGREDYAMQQVVQQTAREFMEDPKNRADYERAVREGRA